MQQVYFGMCQLDLQMDFVTDLGAEVGVSTGKTHSRGPVGLEGLVIYKYKLYGNGQGVGQYGQGKREFLHEEIQYN